ncbi:hypothetical protein TNCV_1873421 [Trichonephila clavipes]|nr:hypothetical protein TNCV_1873421 [Trichonephila clavipes]
MELKWREIFSKSLHSQFSPQETFGPSDLTSTYSVCTRRVFGGTGIEPRPSGPEFGALTTRLPTATYFTVVVLINSLTTDVGGNPLKSVTSRWEPTYITRGGLGGWRPQGAPSLRYSSYKFDVQQKDFESIFQPRYLPRI